MTRHKYEVAAVGGEVQGSESLVGGLVNPGLQTLRRGVEELVLEQVLEQRVLVI